MVNTLVGATDIKIKQLVARLILVTLAYYFHLKSCCFVCIPLELIAANCGFKKDIGSCDSELKKLSILRIDANMSAVRRRLYYRFILGLLKQNKVTEVTSKLLSNN